MFVVTDGVDDGGDNDGVAMIHKDHTDNSYQGTGVCEINARSRLESQWTIESPLIPNTQS